MRSNPSVIVVMLTFLIFLLFSNISVVESTADTTLTSSVCNVATWPGGPTDPYGENVNEMLDQLVSDAPNDPDKTHQGTNTQRGTTVYGYASCNTNLSPGDCQDCLEDAVIQFAQVCPSAIGAQITLVDCRMRYENYQF